MNGLIFVTAIMLGGAAFVWYVEENAERLAEEREINALVRESKRREGRRQGRNPVRFAVCGWQPPRLSSAERRAIRRACKSRH